MSSSVASGYSSRVRGSQRTYTISPVFLESPYLQNPIGMGTTNRSRKKSGSKGDASSQKSSRRLQADNINSKFDAESVATRGSILSARTNQRQRPSPSSGRSKPMKNFLLPREMDNLLREFRQKHSDPAMLTTDANNIKDKYEDDDSTIASAMSLDDDAIYKECLKDDEVKDALFSGSLFAAIATRKGGRKIFEAEAHGMNGLAIIPPSVVNNVHLDKSGDVSDLESLHSMGDNGHRKNRLRRIVAV